MDVLSLSRFQFGDTAAFHILWPIMSIGIAFYLLSMEVMWLRTKKDGYYRQLRFWTKIFMLTFAIGTASGIPLEFEFGTNWAAFSHMAGDFFGNILGFETTVAFALEAAFLGIFLFGWNRVRPAVHLFSNAMIFVGASLSAFWIMAANSWMQVPIGVTVEGGKMIVSDYYAAIFNPDTIVSFMHMMGACIETTLFMMAGISAIVLLRKSTEPRMRQFFLDSFKYCLLLVLFVAPIQLVIGDLSGLIIKEYQPAKLAATELHWQTNAPGEGAEWNIVAIPNTDGGKNDFAITVPDGLSLITTHTTDGAVQGLNDFAPQDRPTVTESLIVFYSFRVMIAIGGLLFLLALLGVLFWKRGKLRTPEIAPRWFWWLFALATPLGFVATEAGWMVREIGRQPWVVYHLLRTSQGLSSNLSMPAVLGTAIVFNIIYLACGILFIYFTWRIVKRGPDLDAPIASPPMPRRIGLQ